MKSRFLTGVVVGVLLGVGLIGGGTYLYFASGYAPVATSERPMPFEELLAQTALHARLENEMPKSAPIEPTEANLLAGAGLYREHCAGCHGLPDLPEAAFAQRMFPPAPQLFRGKGVTDDEPGETFWKTANGIRLTGMPAFRGILKDQELWQISWLLAKANELTPPVKNALTSRLP